MLTPVLTYNTLALAYGLFFYISLVTTKRNSGDLKKVIAGKGCCAVLVIRLLAGIILMGSAVAVILINRPFNEKILLPAETTAGPLWIFLAALAGFTGITGVKKRFTSSLSNKPHIPASFPLSFILLRTLFLIVYEIFFRGIMLFCMIEDAGMITAVGTNLFLYVLIHWHSEKQERYGSIPMGLILSFITIYYQSVWPAVAVHTMLALSNEIGILLTNKSLIKTVRL